MASTKILEQKKEVVNEIVNKLKSSESVIIFQYAILFGKELLEPIKIVSEFAKKHDKLDIRVGVISGNVADLAVIKEYATIPSREGLLTMLAGGMMQYVKDLAIGLNLYAEQLEGKE